MKRGVKMKGAKSFRKMLKKELKNLEFKKAFEKEEEVCSTAIFKARKKLGKELSGL